MAAEVASVQKKEDPLKSVAMEMGKNFAMSKLQGMGGAATKKPEELNIGPGEQVDSNPRDRYMSKKMSTGVV